VAVPVVPAIDVTVLVLEPVVFVATNPFHTET
jgi:hypothetical protein